VWSGALARRHWLERSVPRAVRFALLGKHDYIK